jgi:hypothetical protein
MTSRSVVFAEPVRTAIGTFGGSLKDVPAPALGAVALGAAVARASGRAGVSDDGGRRDDCSPARTRKSQDHARLLLFFKLSIWEPKSCRSGSRQLFAVDTNLQKPSVSPV